MAPPESLSHLVENGTRHPAMYESQATQFFTHQFFKSIRIEVVRDESIS